jgi:hypothetical protein
MLGSARIFGNADAKNSLYLENNHYLRLKHTWKTCPICFLQFTEKHDKQACHARVLFRLPAVDTMARFSVLPMRNLMSALGIDTPPEHMSFEALIERMNQIQADLPQELWAWRQLGMGELSEDVGQEPLDIAEA